MEPIQIPWGRQDRLELKIPAGWRLVAQSQVKAPEAIPDLPRAVRAALDIPIGSAPLREFIKPETRIALVMDDIGRPTPVHRLAPVVLDYLLEAGARPENIMGLFAVGTHQLMNSEDMEARAGSSVVSRIQCLNFDCRDEKAFVHLGKTKRGTPVFINRIASEADLRVLIGTIEAHPQAGFGGGFKNILPGLASAESIGHNHLLMPSADRYNMIGTLPEENPMRLDLEEAGHMVSGPTFILNVVLNPFLEPVALVAGNAVAAHRSGVEISRKIYGFELPRPFDVVISSAYPMDEDMRQAGKGVLNVAGACRPGGVIIGFLRCERGLERLKPPGFSPPLGPARVLVKMLGSRGIAFLVRHLPAAVPVEARFLINFALQMLKDYQVLIFSPRLKEITRDRFPRILYDDQDRIFREAERLIGRSDPEVVVFHQGGVSFPVVSSA
jgi:nickel-dependent lactate racemase